MFIPGQFIVVKNFTSAARVNLAAWPGTLKKELERFAWFNI